VRTPREREGESEREERARERAREETERHAAVVRAAMLMRLRARSRQTRLGPRLGDGLELGAGAVGVRADDDEASARRGAATDSKCHQGARIAREEVAPAGPHAPRLPLGQLREARGAQRAHALRHGVKRSRARVQVRHQPLRLARARRRRGHCARKHALVGRASTAQRRKRGRDVRSLTWRVLTWRASVSMAAAHQRWMRNSRASLRGRSVPARAQRQLHVACVQAACSEQT
jgi:hypothetical protein